MKVDVEEGEIIESKHKSHHRVRDHYERKSSRYCHDQSRRISPRRSQEDNSCNTHALSSDVGLNYNKNSLNKSNKIDKSKQLINSSNNCKRSSQLDDKPPTNLRSKISSKQQEKNSVSNSHRPKDEYSREKSNRISSKDNYLIRKGQEIRRSRNDSPRLVDMQSRSKQVKFDSSASRISKKVSGPKQPVEIEDDLTQWNDSIDFEEEQLEKIRKRREERLKQNISKNSEELSQNLQDKNISTQEPVKSREPEFGNISPEVHHENPPSGFTNPTPKKKNIAEKINDMFADDFEVNCAKAQNETEITNSDAITHLNDNYDDAEGYYKIRIGEVINDKYLIKSFIGQGVFSNVVCAQSIEGEDEGSEVAIKIIRNNDLMYNQGLKELNVLKLLNDADEFQKYNIMQLLGNFQFKNHLCIVFPKMNMNLREVLKQYGKDVGLSIMAVASYAKQLFRALKLLEKCELIHADIKPDNILVCNNNIKIKLADFGSVLKSHENDFTPYLVSRFYRAPEIIIGHPYGFPVDMWSVGVTLFELFTGHVMFPGASNNQMLLKMCEMMGKIPNRLIQRSLFRNKHFDEQGTFLYRDLDPITQNERVTPVYFTENSSSKRDLLTELKKYALHHVNAAKSYNQENNSNGENNSSGSEYRSKSSGPSVVGTRAYIDKKVNQFKDLLEKILTINPQKRYDTTSALHHAFTLD